MTHDYFVLDPKSGYFDPVVRFVDKFSLETLGVVEDPVSGYDWDKIASFNNSISYRDNCYYVDLPWK